jgi:hypothetical protein
MEPPADTEPGHNAEAEEISRLYFDGYKKAGIATNWVTFALSPSKGQTASRLTWGLRHFKGGNKSSLLYVSDIYRPSESAPLESLTTRPDPNLINLNL